MNIDKALQTFIAEARGLLQDMESLLLQLEAEPSNTEVINALFRAAHTIKGSAGLFGLEAIVAFTHRVESVLDLIREGKIQISEELIGVLLQCRDHIDELVEVTAVEGGSLDESAQARGNELTLALNEYLQGAGAQAPAPAVPAEQHPAPAATDSPSRQTDAWHISLKFGPDLFRHGMDPLSFINYLSGLGEIVNLKTSFDAMPEPCDMDAESCYLAVDIEFRGNADKAAIENVFEFVRDDCEIRITPPTDHIAQYADRISNASGDPDLLGAILMEAGAVTPNELEQALKTQHAQDTDASAPGAEQSKPPLGQILVDQGAVPKEAVHAALEKQRQVREHKAQESAFVRVHAAKLDQLINLVGELVIAGASANLLAQQSGVGALQEATSAMARLVEEIREGALRLRMVEIGETFQRFPRVVRDVSRALDKAIELVITGAETELDKGMVEGLADPLMHLVRNAIDHGIEPAAERAARGKPARGRVSLHAYHDSGSIVIEVADDGGGLPKAALLAKARARGLVGAEQTPSDSELYQLIFEPGFSTAGAVTNLSGRGVGMDVVRRNVEALRGTVEVESAEGVGTTVRLRLPLTLAIIDGFLVGVARAAYVIPLDMVLECVELAGGGRRAGYLNLRGEVLPLLHLRERFGLEGAAAGRRANVVVVQAGGQ
ncbi:MAG: chemotaxis protein CheA, partial [Gammaproteobacteria bacterium]